MLLFVVLFAILVVEGGLIVSQIKSKAGRRDELSPQILNYTRRQ
ncbi:hypothetical protein D8I24_0539 (plasmid) [Cupriavidus necator H850]|nr:hypothetical protein D8I24_0539 [Cupriavidus necator H850]